MYKKKKKCACKSPAESGGYISLSWLCVFWHLFASEKYGRELVSHSPSPPLGQEPIEATLHSLLVRPGLHGTLQMRQNNQTSRTSIAEQRAPPAPLASYPCIRHSGACFSKPRQERNSRSLLFPPNWIHIFQFTFVSPTWKIHLKPNGLEPEDDIFFLLPTKWKGILKNHHQLSVPFPTMDKSSILSSHLLYLHKASSLLDILAAQQKGKDHFQVLFNV